MPPLPSQKGTGKKGRDARQSRSRNTTPSLVGPGSSIPQSDSATTAFLELPISSFRTSDDLNETYGSTIPSSNDLEALLKRLDKLIEVVDTRGNVCDRGMRMLSQARKDRLEEIETERRDEERKERLKRDAADEEERGRNKANKMKKKKDLSTAREERPLTHGAHGLAPQDGSNLGDRSSPMRDKKPVRKMSRDNDSASSSLSPAPQATPTTTGMEIDEKEDRDDDDSSSDEHQPLPAAPIQHLQTFGDDPSTFPDPTVYEIRPVTKDMTVDQKKEIYSVAYFPQNSLDDLIPGTPPDKDFSNAKPTNQVQANTFMTYLEPYFRSFTEEDLAFLRERGDRSNAFMIPRRQKRHYTEVWADEDNAIDGTQHNRDRLPANQARGNIENLTDEVGETDQISAGPILSRLLAALRPEHRAPAAEPTTNGLANGEGTNGEVNSDAAELSQILESNAPPAIPPATFMKESESDAWKKATHPKLDHAQVDERIKQELRHIGFLPPDTEPDFDGHFDDEIAARLRYLQAKLRDVAVLNGARKARLQELTKERMAHQEFTTILEDLDSQVQTAYLKRTRTLGKSKKTKRPGGAGGGSHFVAGGSTGMARPGIGDLTKTLMERRSKWINTIGGVLDKDANQVRRNKDPDSSIFKPEYMADLLRKEKESWDEDAEEE
ncbi:related to NGG1-general transcriptional adaptor or co-activator [Phialocephala subalpina]|uniref:Related to NGG1-general transcriptional adaptor or co-activator n=1 Tax=Phialocephala subalpina TaxID=576137 RepID=A0A1L7WQ08_9HELO|nr:related to NGG1-general transcriptional adaptor or co-activator [Phialocephala subalpina]